MAVRSSCSIKRCLGGRMSLSLSASAFAPAGGVTARPFLPSLTRGGYAAGTFTLPSRSVQKKSSVRGSAVRNTEKFEGYDLDDAIKLMKCFALATIDETVEITVKTGADPRKADQIIRGVCVLPHGTGKTTKVAVFAKGAKAEEATKAGADLVGAEDLVAQIQEGKIDFNRCIATPDMMPIVGRVARILGPRGLMPNPKMGTVTMNVNDAVSSAKSGGEVQFKCDKTGNVLIPVGKASMDSHLLAENIGEFITYMNKTKPPAIKGAYFKQCYLSSTQGKGIKVKVAQYPFKGRPQAQTQAVAQAQAQAQA